MANIETLKYWCHKVLPLVYDDSLSYYEVLCKVSAKLNEVIGVTNEFGEHINEQLLEMRELINTELARIESEFDRKLVEAETAIKEELTRPNSFNGNAIVDGSIADNKLVSKFWHFFNRVPVRQYADLDDILNTDNTENIIRLTVSGLGELNGIIGAGDYTCITNTNNTAMVLLNTETGVSWIYEKGSNNIVPVDNIADGSITSEKLANDSVTGEKIASGSVTGGVGGKIKDHTITDFNIATGTLTGRVFADNSVGDSALANTYVKYLFINGYSVANINEALQVGGDKTLYYMWTDPTGDLTPNEQVAMYGFARNTASVGEEATYEVVFANYAGRTWKYVQSTGSFRETNIICETLFTVDNIINYVKEFKKDCLAYVEIPIGIIPIGYYICTRDHEIITLRSVSDKVSSTYICDVNTKTISFNSVFKYLSNVSFDVLANCELGYKYFFDSWLAGVLHSSGLSEYVVTSDSGGIIRSASGEQFIFNKSDNSITPYTYPLNVNKYAPTLVFSYVLTSKTQMITMLNEWLRYSEVESGTIYISTTDEVSSELWHSHGVIFDVKVSKMIKTTYEGNPYWRFENLRTGEIKFVVLTSSTTADIID